MAPSSLSPAWQALQAHAKTLTRIRLTDLFEQDHARADRFALELEGLFLDYSKNRLTNKTIDLLRALAEEAQLAHWIERLFAGEPVNGSEGRPAFHMALRADPAQPMRIGEVDVMPEVAAQLARMEEFSEALRGGRWTGYDGRPIADLVSIGIGGSYLGPALAVEALAGPKPTGPRVHFLANPDGGAVSRLLAGLDPATTLFLVVSKSFTTAETKLNADAARDWFLAQGGKREDLPKHFRAVSTNRSAVAEFGLDADAAFAMWDWVGGRYSLWSTVGLPIAVAHGFAAFRELLAGARAMDRHFRSAPIERNMPALLALIGLWYNGCHGAESHAIIPYDSALGLLPAYLQQLVMESNGKGVTRDGKAVTMPTSPVVWGGVGTEVQHAFLQAFHQGPRLLPVDFIGVAEDRHGRQAHHEMLLANLIGQAEALMGGSSQTDTQRTCPGNRPSNVILMQRLDARTLGQLLALYEHKTFVEGVVWHINSFDQWGVELGKKLASRVEAEIHYGDALDHHDPSTAALIRRVRNGRGV
ncbi:glucose-6-phosphate isomerase [Hypericibacter adhaerens]|uniref:Glucose-6-phosphate isomerase n=1 Tax=Hypericibacter adhaerens TaxID=2602016 RepID=A0A5J6MW45_9PROT|nr:glucose-6-phosphate isomerase [Hypericibacter adhaerens]QEX21337.1 glucose-6-phosphate isomerase [Hypericibacter adhaerens]